jgi:hypothetical protein
MPRMMSGVSPFEFLFSPSITHMLFERTEFSPRRIYTDGRDWPAKLEPSFMGTSIGRWIDEDGDGRYDVLEVETRGFRGPRLVENTGIPLHVDNQTITKERIYLDKAKGDTLYDQVTIIDHAFTRPWTVTRAYSRDAKPVWTEFICHEHNTLIIIKGETYFIREDGYLMPSRRDQVAPDLRKFEETRADR